MSDVDYTKDFMGNSLQEGDIVAVIEFNSNKSAKLQLAQVVGFTAKRIKILYIHSHSYNEGVTAWKAPLHVAKVGADNLKDTPLEWLRELLTLNK